MQTELIVRVQDIHGRGPYKPGFSDLWADDDDDRSRCPNEFPADQLRELMATAKAKGFGAHFGFGFRTLEQLQRWFTRTELRRLELWGYRIVELRVDLVIAETETQLLFMRKRPLWVDAPLFRLASQATVT